MHACARLYFSFHFIVTEDSISRTCVCTSQGNQNSISTSVVLTFLYDYTCTVYNVSVPIFFTYDLKTVDQLRAPGNYESKEVITILSLNRVVPIMFAQASAFPINQKSPQVAFCYILNISAEIFK